MKIHSFLLSMLALVLMSCGSGGGGNAITGTLSTAVGVPLSNYVVVNLTNGEVRAYSSLNDITTNNAYKTTHMVFRTMESASAYYGQSSAGFGHQADEVEGIAGLTKYFIGVYEVTQEQWQRMTGTSPWTSIDNSALGLPDWSVVDGEKPASNLSYDSINSGLSTFNSGKSFSFGLPSDWQWEHACRGTSVDLFSWGASMNTAVAGSYAVVRETFGGTDGPEIVGEQSPNAYGLYDCHGNVWEVTSGNYVRGGSWYDNITQARCANKHDIIDDGEHFLVGARLVFIP